MQPCRAAAAWVGHAAVQMMYRCPLYTASCYTVNCALHRANVHSTAPCTLHCTVACTVHCATLCTCRFLMEAKTWRIVGSLPGSQGGAPVLRYTRVGQVSLYKYTVHTTHCTQTELLALNTLHSTHSSKFTLLTVHSTKSTLPLIMLD